ncbi:MAG: hypothetical protein QNJ90_00070 [Planctomycetota bacterium]|nr:hypothetical protein [Planctomycetota bacterium]
MRRALPTLLILAVVAVSFQASAAPSRAAPKNLRELGQRLDDVAVRIQNIVEEASKDPDAARIKLYSSYTPDQMKRTRGRVRAEDLVEWMLDPKKNFVTVRQAAAKALQEGAQFRGDPELSRTEKQGSKSRRAWFCEKHLIKQLAHEDRISRALVSDLLKKLWGSTGLVEITRYNPSNEKTWKPAIKAWRRYLKRQ